ncbi:MAG: sugar ABC transporter permease [Clostridia bacterium]|nr:sugar ABC transporter permease [Clostridia bacterium]
MSAKIRKKHGVNRIEKGEWGFMILSFLPFLLFAYYTVVPVFNAIYQSFYTYSGYGELTSDMYVGWQNYIDILSDPRFGEAALNDLYILIGKMVMVVLLAVTFSVSLTRLKFHKVEVNVLRFLYYIPNILSIVVIAKVWQYFFDLELFSILINQPTPLEGWIGLAPVPIVTFVASWCGIGVFMIILIAAINNISKELYEAADLDGAGQIRQLFSITIPSVLPQVRYMLVSILISIIGSNMNFVKLFIGDGGSFTVMGVYQYYHAFSLYELGYAYAASVLLMLLTFAVSFPLNQLISKKERD